MFWPISKGGKVRVFCSVDPKLPRVHVGLRCHANDKNKQGAIVLHEIQMLVNDINNEFQDYKEKNLLSENIENILSTFQILKNSQLQKVTVIVNYRRSQS